MITGGGGEQKVETGDNGRRSVCVCVWGGGTRREVQRGESEVTKWEGDEDSFQNMISITRRLPLE